MDTSETYIKMCEKAKEIRALWQPREGDYYVYSSKPAMVALTPAKEFIPFDHRACEIGMVTSLPFLPDRKYLVWLPCQDQLQEMLGANAYELLDSIYEFCGDFEIYPYLVAPGGARDCLGQNDYTRQFTSMEQLWLAFVMKEKYNKIWDGEDWVEGS